MPPVDPNLTLVSQLNRIGIRSATTDVLAKWSPAELDAAGDYARNVVAHKAGTVPEEPVPPPCVKALMNGHVQKPDATPPAEEPKPQIPATTETVKEPTAAEKPAEVPPVKGDAARIAELSSALDRANSRAQRIMLACEHRDEQEKVVKEIAQDLKEAKEELEKRDNLLFAEIRSRDGERTLPFPPDSAPVASAAPAHAPVDEFANTPLSHIFTPSQAEKLLALDVETVAHFEKFIAEGKFVPKSVKGLGETAVQKMSDKFIAWRKEHPANKPEPKPDLIDGKWDSTQYHAGKIDRANAKLFDANPNKVGGHGWQSWNEGWKAKDQELADSLKTGDDNRPLPEDAQQALALCGEILARCDESPADHTEDAEKMSERVDSIKQTILDNKAVDATQKQILAAMQKTAKRWNPEWEPKPEQGTVPPAPDEAAENAIEQCDVVIQLCRDIPDQGKEFAADVLEHVRGVREDIVRNGRVTEKETAALDGWEAGLRKWQHE